MYEIKIKDAETGEDFKFFGRKLAEVEVVLRNPARRGMAYFYKTDADHGPAKDTKPLYVVAVEGPNGGFDVEKIRDFHRVQKFFEWVLTDGFSDPRNAHPLFGQLWTFVGNAAMNDLDLVEPLERLKTFRDNAKRARSRAASVKPQPPRAIPAVGFFEEPDFAFKNVQDEFPSV